jgi:hypothetical protein
MARNHILTAVIWHSPRIRSFRHAFSVNRLYRNLSAYRRRLPDYLIVGAQKCGTTSLWEYLNEHPAVEPAMCKEMNFFDRNYDSGLAWYRSHFSLAQDETLTSSSASRTLTGESCANYMFHPLAPERVRASLPQAKIIFLLRNPVDRAYSHYQLKLRRRQESLSFEDAIAAEPERLAGEREKIVADPHYYSWEHDRHSYLARGRYLEQLLHWEKVFPPEQLLVLESGEFFKRTADVYARVLQFLGLPTWQPAEFENRFPGKYSEKMNARARQNLIEYFAPHNQRLYSHLGRRFDWDR